MSRVILAAMLLVALVTAACGTGRVEPSPSPSVIPGAPVASPSPASPRPSVAPSPIPSTPAVTAGEQYLVDGVRRGAIDCAPVRDDLPSKAVAGIECAADDPKVARVGFYLFASDRDMLDVYVARMAAEGVELDSGPCVDGEAEAAYVPGEGLVPSRHGCFVNDQGFANYRATLPGAHVYIGVLGRSADMRALEDFAWRFNQDTPGSPTLWLEPS